MFGLHRTRKLFLPVFIVIFFSAVARAEVTEETNSTSGFLGVSSVGYGSTFAENTTAIPTETVTEHIATQKWKKAEEALKKMFAAAYKQMLPFMLRGNEDMNLSPRCTRGIMKMLTGIKQSKLWAFKMFDSFGKLPNGIISGNINSLGDFDECLEVNVPGHFRGQYCNVDVAPPLPERRPFVSTDSEIPEFVNISHPDSVIADFLKKATHYYRVNFRSSVCVPSTCSKEEIQKIANKVTQMTEMNFDILIPNCEVLNEKFEFSRSEIVIMAVLGILLFLGVSSTMADVFLKLRSDEENYQDSLSLPTKYLLCFSFYTNTARLLKPDTSKDSIKVFHGMKVITILWVILNHTYYYLNYQACSFLLNAREVGKHISFQFIANGFLNVETFFFISAVLITYGVMKMKEKKVNICLYIFRRIWRLTPPFMLVIACVFLIPHLGSGPVWKETVFDQLTEKCRNSWWTNLLFINNFISSEDMCLQWLWYIPVDTHLYFLSLLVIIPLKSNPRLAFAMNMLILVGGIVISGAFHVYYGLTPTAVYAFNHPEDVNHFVDRGYFRTYLHCSTYCIGLAVGYFLASRPSKLHIPLRINLALWLSSFVAALTVLYGVYDWNQGNVPNMALSVLYAGSNKFVWSLALAWVTIACMTGNGGIATSILSWQVFVPLGRLTYMAYLIHPIIHIIYTGSTRTLIRTDHRTLMYVYLGNVLMSFICAYGFSLLFESPFMALEKVLFSTQTTKRPRVSKQSESELPEIVDEKNKHKNGNGAVIEENGICTIKIKQIEANG